MQSKKEEISSNLEILANVFREAQLVETAKQIEIILMEISKNKPLQDLQSSWLKLRKILRNEYTRNDSYMQNIFTVIEDITINPLLQQKGIITSKFKEIIIPSIMNMVLASKNRLILSNLSLRVEKLSEKERFFVDCVRYLIEVEGFFDETLRVLYVLQEAANGNDVSFQDVRDMPIWSLHKKLKKKDLDVSELLFKGWNEGRHLRNAIAHLYIAYNEKTGKMNNFKDYSYKNEKATLKYDEDLSFEEFTKCYSEIEAVNSILLYIILVLRIRNLILQAFENQT